MTTDDFEEMVKHALSKQGEPCEPEPKPDKKETFKGAGLHGDTYQINIDEMASHHLDYYKYSKGTSPEPVPVPGGTFVLQGDMHFGMKLPEKWETVLKNGSTPNPEDDGPEKKGPELESPVVTFEQESDPWYMGGTDGTGEYVVVAVVPNVGRVGYRHLGSHKYRVRIEPATSDGSLKMTLAAKLKGNWNKPDPKNNRFSYGAENQQAFHWAMSQALAALGATKEHANPEASNKFHEGVLGLFEVPLTEFKSPEEIFATKMEELQAKAAEAEAKAKVEAHEIKMTALFTLADNLSGKLFVAEDVE